MKKLSVLLIISLLYFGCAGGNKGKVVVTVNGTPIYRADVRFYLSRMNPQLQAYYSSPRGYQKLLDRLVQNEALYQEAKRRGLAKKSDVRRVLENLKKQVLINALVNEVNKSSIISDTGMKQYFLMHRNEFDTKDRAAVFAVRTKDKVLAAKIERELRLGAKIVDLKGEYAQDTGISFEDLNYVKRGDLTPRLDKLIFSTKPGSMTKVIESNKNYFIFKVNDLKRGDQLTFSDFKDKIRSDMQSNSIGNKMKALSDKLVAKARIKYHFGK